MKRLSVAICSISLVTLLSAAPPARAHDGDCSFDAAHPSVGLGLIDRYETPPPSEDWQGTSWQSRIVTLRSATTGAQLCATLFAPIEPLGALPAVVIVNASGQAVQTHYHWSARELASNGYVVITIDPQGQGRSDTFKQSASGMAVGPDTCDAVPTPDDPSPCPGVPFQQFENFLDAVISGIDYITSPANPFFDHTDTTRVGAAGHSMGARAVSYAQGIDARIDAIVAWDNLASTNEGDNGSASGGWPMSSVVGGEVPGFPDGVIPRVPAMGQASEYGTAARAGHPLVLDEPTAIGQNPEWKKTAYRLWRDAEVPAMQLVFDRSVHGSWAQGPWTSAQQGWSGLARNLQYYTRAWFDRFLKDDDSATDRLLAMNVNGSSRGAVLSDLYHSAAYVDGVDCEDLEDPARDPSCDGAPMATSLSYDGETRAQGESVSVAAVLSRDDGSPLKGRQIRFVAAGASVTLATDGTGRAAGRLTIPDHGRQRSLTVEYAGERRFMPASTSATITWGGPPE